MTQDAANNILKSIGINDIIYSQDGRKQEKRNCTEEDDTDAETQS